MTATATAFVDVFKGWLGQGVHEVPDGSNRTPIGDEFGWNGVAWCCEATCVALARTGLACLHTASVDAAIAAAKAGHAGMRWHPKGSGRPAVGWSSTFDFGPARRAPRHGNPEDFHISTVELPLLDGRWYTIGGNESNRVMRQVRDDKFLQGFIEWPFVAPPAAPAVPTWPGRMLQVTWPVRMTGEDVRTIRKACIRFGSKMAANDDYDLVTKDAVTWWQHAFGLTADGVVGPVTWKAFLSR